MNNHVFHQGSVARYFYVVHSGEFEIRRNVKRKWKFFDPVNYDRTVGA